MDESPETSRSVHPNSLDIAKLSSEAQRQWLSPAEICEILRNYKKLQITAEPSNKPPSGSLFLFDRKVTRNFRKDGHNWQRKENGKLAKEGHKKLKAGSIDVLHCYYALGEENKNFQRRCYSMLEKDFSHIVLVHYLELTVTEKIMPNSEIDSSSSSGSRPNNCLGPSENTDRYLDSAQPLERENAQPAIPGKDLAPTQSDKGKSDNDAESTDVCQLYLNLESWEGDLESCHPCSESMEDQSSSSSSHPDTGDKLPTDSFVGLSLKEHSQIRAESKQVHPDTRNDSLMENCLRTLLSNDEQNYALQPNPDGCFNLEGKSIHSSGTGHLFDGILTEEGSKEMSSSGANRETGENENENDVSSIPSEGKLNIQDINAAENYSSNAGANLLLRFDNILWSASSATNSVTSSLEDASQLSSKISSLLKGDNKELDQMLKTGSGMKFSPEKLKDQLLQKHLKEKLRVWILQKKAEGGYGPRILDEDGQGVLHLAAALGYDWALKPTIDAGVRVDFLDVNGWTALHWAASCGRENTVATLISFGAYPGASTKRSPEYPSGITPADLASANGHKRISVYLGKRPLNSFTAAFSEFRLRRAEYMPKRHEFLRKKHEFLRREAEFMRRGAECMPREAKFL